ncbi:MAG: hypothetical protein J07HX64_00961 [halophilic archaeon J07HX64]|nr:MAG: hypothetical protein J07HX64_00961 [halophilic archaeon J07HX64]
MAGSDAAPCAACQRSPPGPPSGSSPTSAHHDRGSSAAGSTCGASTTSAATGSPVAVPARPENAPIGSTTTGATGDIRASSSATTPSV